MLDANIGSDGPKRPRCLPIPDMNRRKVVFNNLCGVMTMTAIVIGLLSVSAGAVFSVGFGALIVGDVLMAFGVFIGIKGLLVTLIETLRADPTSEVATLPRPAGRPGAYPAPPASHAVPLRGPAGGA